MLNKQFAGEHKLFLFVGFLTFVVLFTVMNINHRFAAMDFEVYYYAAKAFLEGKPVYGVAFGNSEVGFFKYSPFSLLFYFPATLLPFKVTATINYFIMVLAGLFSILISSQLIVRRVYSTNRPVTNALLFITLFLSLTFLTGKSEWGTLIICCSCLSAWLLFIRRNKNIG
jgi:uncharacterized membrane protein YhaH (DUF805 family)